MHIALIGCTVNPRTGGMGRALHDHATALAEAGQEVTVYTLENKIGYFLRLGKAAWGVRFDPPLDAYDVVHLHLPFFGVGDSVVLEMLKQVQHDKKLVATYHMDAIGTGLKRAYFNWWYCHRFKKVLAACDAIAVTSRAYARDSWLARVGVDVEKCEEILLRVDTDVFNLSLRAQRSNLDGIASSTASPRNDYFLFVGALDRAHYFKGLSLLLRAFKSLDPGYPRGADSGMTESPRLVVVGSGELLNDYKKEAAQLGIADRVHFTGGVSDEELAQWYSGARALVLPSIDRSEAFGIVLIEAMACGTPVIASDLPGVREVVGWVRGGILVPLGIASSPVAPRNDSVGAPRNDILAAALQEMWQHPWGAEERIALAQRAAATYGRATLAEQLLQWYNGVHVPSR